MLHFTGDCFKVRSHTDSVSASSGSPQNHGSYHPIAPLAQLRDMLTTSDHEHGNSIDHNDVKDLSLRGQPQQAPVITSTAPIIHLDTSNHDFDSSASRSSSVHMDNGQNSPHHGGSSDSVLRTVRMRKLSDSSHHDHEHNTNSYKFKNYIQQRFSQDTNHHDDISVITDCSNKSPSPSVTDNLASPSAVLCKKPKLCMDYIEGNSCDEKPTTNGIGADFKSEVGSFPIFSKPIPCSVGLLHSPVPIFALHSNSRFYVPLNVEYDALVPYLGSVDLSEKNCGGPMPPLHAININVNFMNTSSRSKGTTCLTRPKSDINGW